VRAYACSRKNTVGARPARPLSLPFTCTYPAAVRAVARVLKEPAATAVSTMSLVPTLEEAKRAVDGREVGVGSMKAETVAVQARTVAKARIVGMCGNCGGVRRRVG